MVIVVSRKRARWIRWIRTIRVDLAGLAEWSDAYADAMRLLSSVDDARASRAATLLREVCVQAMAMGVRRQLKRGSRNITLAGLLDDIVENAAGEPADVVEGPGLSERARADLALLRRSIRGVEHYADRAVAHADRRSGGEVSISDVRAAIVELMRVHDRYAHLVGEPGIGFSGEPPRDDTD